MSLTVNWQLEGLTLIGWRNEPLSGSIIRMYLSLGVRQLDVTQSLLSRSALHLNVYILTIYKDMPFH